MNTNKIKKTQSKKISEAVLQRLEKANREYQKAMLDLTPFLPKTQSKEVTTEGAWQKTSNFSLY